MKKPTADQIDAILPQTQCGLCNYKGCKPYAEAIASGEDTINHCPPGGIKGLKKLGELTGIDPEPYIAEMTQEQKPLLTAVIREDECIGCTKCITACPVDAILGASKQMHTVITDECNGCELCVEPCPVDCIDIIKIGEPNSQDEKTFQAKAKQYRTRYYQREARLARDKALLKRKHDLAKLAYKKIAGKEDSLQVRKQAIAEAVARVKAKKQ